jgi:integrase
MCQVPSHSSRIRSKIRERTVGVDHRLYAVFHLIALRGLRRGEAAGLRWCDVDLEGSAAMISQ